MSEISVATLAICISLFTLIIVFGLQTDRIIERLDAIIKNNKKELK